ncbi:MAG: hypothetical protein HQL80_05485 [Magnetococcales bacterium]|nr:hypothetical protein [Magnetococcales bacterium]
MLDLPARAAITQLSAAEAKRILESKQPSDKAKPAVAATVAEQAVPPVVATVTPAATPAVAPPAMPAVSTPVTATAHATPLPPGSQASQEKSPPPAAVESTRSTASPSATVEQEVKPDPLSLPLRLEELDQRLTARVNNALEQVTLLSNKVTEMAQQGHQTATELGELQRQLTEIQARLRLIEQKSVVTNRTEPTQVAPVVSEKRLPLPPKVALEPAPDALSLLADLPELLYAGASVAVLLLMLLLVRLRRKRVESQAVPVLDAAEPVVPVEPSRLPAEEPGSGVLAATEPERVVQVAVERLERSVPVATEPPLTERRVVPSAVPESMPTPAPAVAILLERLADATDWEDLDHPGEAVAPQVTLSPPAKPVKTVLAASPFQEEEGESGLVAPLASLRGGNVGRVPQENTAPVSSHYSAELQDDERVEEIAGDEDGEEESIFKELLEGEPRQEREPPLPVRRAGLAVATAGKEGDEPLEMFEFNPVAVAPVSQKTAVAAPPKTAKPAQDLAGGVVLEWVEDEK